MLLSAPRRLLLATAAMVVLGLAACSSSDDPVQPAADDTPPAAVGDLRVATAAAGFVTLTWTAPGDDGDDGDAAAYDIRVIVYAGDVAGFDDWNVVGNPPSPGAGGVTENVEIGGLTADVVYVFKLRAADEAGNWSGESNPVIVTAAPQHDTTAPAAVGDLDLERNWGRGVTLRWTPAGDDDQLGMAADVDLRYHDSVIDGTSWDDATPVTLDDGGAAGTARVGGLALDTQYWFALRSSDEVGNLSPLSNVAAVRTDAFRTWYVTAAGDGDVGDIRTACIDSATAGDVVLLAPGRYTYTNQNSGNEYAMIYFPRDSTGITLRGEAGAEATIIDAEGLNRVIYILGQGTDIEGHLTLEGLTITGGNASMSSQGYEEGGGVVIHLSAPHFIDCVFRDNVALDGGGFAQAGVCAPVFDRCVFRNNRATHFGGGYFAVNSEPTSTLRDCVFIDNEAVEAGGALFSVRAAFTLIDCLIVENSAGIVGGGISCTEVHPSLISGCTIARNGAPEGGCLRLRDAGTVLIEHSILALSTAGGAFSMFGDGGSLGVSCSDIYGNVSGDSLPAMADDLGDNFGVNPLFCDVSGEDAYGLQASSPCRPGQHPDGGDCGLIGARDEVCGGGF